MRYMDLVGHTHKGLWMLVDIDIIMRVFMKIISYQMSINRGRTTTTEGAHASFVRTLSFLLFLSW